jgi:hypothetical protein
MRGPVVCDGTLSQWRASKVRLFVLSVVAVALAALVAPAPAEAAIISARNWRVQPKGVAGTGVPVIINGGGSFDAYPLDISTVAFYRDGDLVPRAAYTATTPFGRNLYLYHLPQPAFVDGPHTLAVRIADTLGRVSAYEWSVTIAQPPTASWTGPAPGAEITDGRPVISMSLADNTPGTAFAVSGQVRTGSATGAVVATFGDPAAAAGAAEYRLAEELPPGMYYLTASVSDDAGNVRWLSGTAARAFTVVSEPAMTLPPATCLGAGCHAATGHPATGMSCESCHVYVIHEYAQCEDCHGGHAGPVTVTGVFGPCDVCHDPDRPSVPGHTKTSTTPDHMSSCNGCHNESLIDRHAVTPTGSMFAYQCDLCHASADPRVAGAVTAGDMTCGACHDVGADHGAYSVALHTSDDTCLGTCHNAELGPEHVALTPSVGCAECHLAKVAEVKPWDSSCSACHELAQPATHPTPGTTHVGSDALVRDYTANFSVRTSMSWKTYQFGCTPTQASGQRICHDVSNLATLHAGLPNGGCAVCHTGSGPAANGSECITCHGTGWYSPSTSSGTIARPGSDHASSGTITRVGGSGADSFSTVTSNDGATSYLQLGSTNAEALFGRGTWWLNPATTAITNVAVQFRALKMGTATTASRMTAVLDVGGTLYASTAVATNPSATAWTLYTHTFTTNPKTGVAWTAEDLNDPTSANGLRAFGIRQTAADTAPIGVTEVLLKVTTPATNYPDYPVSGGRAHHYGDYLRSPQTPAGEWSSAIYTQYCYDRCHVYPNAYAYYGQVLGNPTYNPFDAYQGTQMWSSLMGDPNGNSPLVRNLTLAPVELPAASATLEFMTNYVLGAADSGQVQVSTDDGATWSTVSGTVDGVPVTTFTGTAGAWQLAQFDLSAYAGQTIRLRFRYEQGPASTTAGWCIDTVSISADGTVLFSDDAETLKPEWDTGSHWRRIQYALRWLG